jgi:DNA modification methylase
MTDDLVPFEPGPTADDPIEEMDISELAFDPLNARRHTERNLATIEHSIEEVGLWRSIAIDENNKIVAGNATVETAGQLGITKVRVVEASGDEIIAVRRRGLSDAQKTRYGLFDNRAAEHAEWNEVVIKQMQDLGTDFNHIFSGAEVAHIISQIPLPMEELERANAAPPLPADPITKPGDMWLIGRHILVCGDATDPEVIDALFSDEVGSVAMTFTDPPYNVDYTGKTKDALKIKGDKNDPAAFDRLLKGLWTQVVRVSRAGAPYYVCHPGGPIAEAFYRTLRECGMPLRQQLVWAKNTMVLGHSDYHYMHEPIAYGWTEGSHYWNGGRDQVTLWEVDRPTASKEHPTMKPVELVNRALRNSTEPNDLVYDPCGGSGTTMIACEHADRVCRMAELDPAYCDVIVARWRNLGFEEPRRVLDGVKEHKEAVA